MLALVVDSSSNLTRTEAAQLGATMVPMTYFLDGVLFDESFLGENGDFSCAVAESRITDAKGVAPERFVPVFRSLAEAGYDVLCITTSSKVSSTYRSACKAADYVRSAFRREAGGTSREANSAAAARTQGLARIAVLDSESSICGVESLARQARGLEAARLDFDQIVAGLEQARLDQGIAFSVRNTDALRRCGRMALIPLSVGSLLNRFPVLTMRRGSICHVGTSRGTQALARDLAACVPTDGDRELTLTHFGPRSALAVEVLRAVKALFPQRNIRVKEGGPVLASILGDGAVSLAWGPAPQG